MDVTTGETFDDTADARPYGRVGYLTAKPGRHRALAAILRQAATLVGALPSCRLYLVAGDRDDDHRLWVYEIWDDEAAHAASLTDPAVRALIGEAAPLLAGPPEGAALTVLGGNGMPD